MTQGKVRYSHGEIGTGSAHNHFRPSLIPATRPAPPRARASTPWSGTAAGAWGMSVGMVKTKQRPGTFRSRAFYFTAALVARHAQWPLCVPRVSIAVAKAQ